MKQRYRLYLRKGGIFYTFDRYTAQHQSLRTRDRQAALCLLHHKNEAERNPALNLEIARTYLKASDSAFASRTWQDVMDEMARLKQGTTRERWQRAMQQKPFEIIRNLRVAETRSKHLLDVLAQGTVSTNIFLRRLHNFALSFSWLTGPLIPRQHWPALQFKEKRAITWEEHQRVVASERGEEWRAYYGLLWHLGGSQTDIASLHGEDVVWSDWTLSYGRLKNGTNAQIHFGDQVAAILRSLPKAGPLFPTLIKWHESWRAKAFIRRCKLAGVKGVSLHSYRYAWAERARAVGYPERFAQEALGHKSKAVHRAYAKKAQVKLPSLEDYEAKLNADRMGDPG